jgi:ribose 1,5-bisphosphokinase
VLPPGVVLVTVENGGKLEDAGDAFLDTVTQIARA